MGRRIVLVLVSTMLALAVACGGGGKAGSIATSQTTTIGTSASPTVTEDSLAKSLLLTVADFPSGWAEKPSQAQNEKLFQECSPKPSKGRTGDAKTGDFSRGDTATISEEVAIFDTNQHVLAALAGQPSIADCVVKLVNSGKADDNTTAFSDASFSPLSFPQQGDRTAAYRLQVHVKAKGQTGLGSEGDAFVDVITVTIGRVGLSVEASDVFSPFDAAELEQVVSKATSRAQPTQPR